MRRSLLRITLSAMLLLMINCQKISAAEPNLQPSPFACLSRDAKERVASCFDTNFECHLALTKASEPAPPDWKVLALAILGGAVVGAITEHQMHH